jgi:broad-specificity NMP kinase
MGKRNYLIEGVSGVGKTSVCHELRRRGYTAFNGDRDLRRGTNQATGDPLDTFSSAESRHAGNFWDVEKVRQLAADQTDDVAFFCGGSRNFNEFIDVFDKVFILDVDPQTLNHRLDTRADDDWGKGSDERELILRLHATREDLPRNGIVIDATQPLDSVVDEILRHAQA